MKLLTVQSVAARFPAADSEYRNSVENGFVSVESFDFIGFIFLFQDEDAGRTEGEGLNDFPEMRLMLNPGGCASYTLPLKEDQVGFPVGLCIHI